MKKNETGVVMKISARFRPLFLALLLCGQAQADLPADFRPLVKQASPAVK